mmetsp:Transcript_29323/g.84150  ORF Transcript_29323/g.84150 Transcript_29323/m.84150 type:complete len:517 (+) Transcript_29323:1152-2702(+)
MTHVVVAQAQRQRLQLTLGLSRPQFRTEGPAIPAPKHAQRGHEGPHESLQREEKITQKKTAGHKNVEEMHGGSRLKSHILNHLDRIRRQVLQEHLRWVAMHLGENCDRDVEQKAYQTLRRPRPENHDPLAVSAAEADTRADADVGQEDQPCGRHHQETQQRHHQACRRAPGLVDVVHRIPCQGDEDHHSHETEGEGDAAVAEDGVEHDHVFGSPQVLPHHLGRLTDHVANPQPVHPSIGAHPAQRAVAQRQPLRRRAVRQQRRLRGGRNGPAKSARRGRILEKPLLDSQQVVVVREHDEDRASVPQAVCSPGPQPSLHLHLVLRRKAQPMAPGHSSAQVRAVRPCIHIQLHQDFLQQLRDAVLAVPVVVAHRHVQVLVPERLPQEPSNGVIVRGIRREALHVDSELRQASVVLVELLHDAPLARGVREREGHANDPENEVADGSAESKHLHSVPDLVALVLDAAQRDRGVHLVQVGRLRDASSLQDGIELRPVVDPCCSRTHDAAVQEQEVVPLVE